MKDTEVIWNITEHNKIKYRTSKYNKIENDKAGGEGTVYSISSKYTGGEKKSWFQKRYMCVLSIHIKKKDCITKGKNITTRKTKS